MYASKVRRTPVHKTWDTLVQFDLYALTLGILPRFYRKLIKLKQERQKKFSYILI